MAESNQACSMEDLITFTLFQWGGETLGRVTAYLPALRLPSTSRPFTFMILRRPQPQTAMSVFDDFPFYNSRPIEASELPEGYFHIIPSRVSSSPVDSGVIDQISDEWSRALGKESTVPILDKKTLSSPLYVYPECPPTERGAVFEFATIVALWSGKHTSCALVSEK